MLAELIEDALSSVANLSKSFRTFIIETMELYLTSSWRMNFTQMARCGRSCESRFRQNFKKSFDWMTFNKDFVNTRSKDRIAIAINPCFVPKSGKKTPGLDWFWSGCASAMKRGLEFLGLSVIDGWKCRTWIISCCDRAILAYFPTGHATRRTNIIAYGLRRINFINNLFHSFADIKKVGIFASW